MVIPERPEAGPLRRFISCSTPRTIAMACAASSRSGSPCSPGADITYERGRITVLANAAAAITGDCKRAGRHAMSSWVRIGDRVKTKAEMDARAQRAARGYASLGVGSGEVVAVYMRNDFAFMEASLAAGLCGAYVVPV